MRRYNADFAKEKNCLIFNVPTGHGVLIKS